MGWVAHCINQPGLLAGWYFSLKTIGVLQTTRIEASEFNQKQCFWYIHTNKLKGWKLQQIDGFVYRCFCSLCQKVEQFRVPEWVVFGSACVMAMDISLYCKPQKLKVASYWPNIDILELVG